MSVRTTADEKLEEARKGIQDALVALNEIIIGECWGHDEYKAEFRVDIESAHAQLIELRKKLAR